MKDQIDKIQDKIGESEAKDYEVKLHQHKARFQKGYPELYAMLKSSELDIFVEEYHRFDDQAIEAQKIYKRSSDRSRILTFLTAVFSSLLVISMNYDFMWYGEAMSFKIPVIVFSILGTVTSGLASIYVSNIQNGQLLENWLEKRATAEEYRFLYFETVTKLPKEGNTPEGIKQSLIKLEYFRRFQMDIQRNYYSQRSISLESQGIKLIREAAIAAGLVAILDGVSGTFMVTIPNQNWVFLGGLAIIGAAYASMVTNKELSEQNKRNALRFTRTHSILTRSYARLDEIRTGIAEGNLELLTEFVKVVHAPMKNENQQWLKNMGSANDELNKLTSVLDELKKKREGGTST